MFTDDETGRLLDAAAAELNGAGPDSDEARLIDVTRRRWEKSRRVPTELEAELARASSEGQEAWVTARAASDFKSFAPYLERILELTRRYVDCHLGHDGFECAYDVLIDDYEPGIRTARVDRPVRRAQGRAGTDDRDACARRRRSMTSHCRFHSPSNSSASWRSRSSA